MFKSICCLFVFIFPLIMRAQTKLIAHKSHSGSSSSFIICLEQQLFDIDNSNFGMAPERMVTSSQLDSVVFISDSVSVMYTSEYCGRGFRADRYKGSKWSAGSDTVRHHPLFSMQHQLDSIKRTLKSSYFFANEVDSVKFIGFDNQRAVKPGNRRKQQEYLPVIDHFDDDVYNRPLLILLVLLISILAGLVSQKFIKA